MNITQHIANEINKNKVHIPLSGVTSYHLLSGSLALSNSVITAGMGTFLYTGNTTTLPTINLGMDIQSQWGNLATETFGYLIEIKSRSAVGSWYWVDSVRGITKAISSDSTAAEVTDANMFTLSTVAGVTTVNIGTSTKTNTNAVTYVMTVWQTTHRTTGTTNHGKTFNCHYNPFMGLTIDGYEGSGLAGHEIPHHLGRKLGFATVKVLTLGTENWHVKINNNSGDFLALNITSQLTTNAALFPASGDESNFITVGTHAGQNASANQFIMYGWANSYFDVQNNLIGNYEVGVYQGTGATGNKVTTRGKPAWVMRKRLDATSQWMINDNMRTVGDASLYANLSNAEDVGSSISIVSDGFLVQETISGNETGSQYLYMVVYDNDAGSGKSKYPRATDTSNLTLNAVVPFANGLDAQGSKNSILTFNETLSGLTYQLGKNYVYKDNLGNAGVAYHKWKVGNEFNGFGDYFDVNTNKWYQSPSVFSDTMDTTANWTATSATLSSVNGMLKVTGTAGYGYAYKGIATVVGKKYKLVVESHAGSQDNYLIRIGTTSSASDIYDSGFKITYGDNSVTFTASTTTTYVLLFTGSTSGMYTLFDNYAIYPIDGLGNVDISGATPITNSRNYLDAIVYADAGGQPTYVEQLPKTKYEDIVKANEFQGKNACTAWVVFDNTTTPPTIIESFNVSAVIRTATGVDDIYYKTPMDTPKYGVCGSSSTSYIFDLGATPNNQVNKCTVRTQTPGGVVTNSPYVSVHIYGGKN